MVYSPPQENIYMQQPPGYSSPENPNQVCRLLKTLYGLKQSSRQQYQQLVDIMTKLGFLRCEVDQAVFYWRKRRMLIIVLVHVDDCTIVGTSCELVTRFKTEISRHVESLTLVKYTGSYSLVFFNVQFIFVSALTLNLPCDDMVLTTSNQCHSLWIHP